MLMLALVTAIAAPAVPPPAATFTPDQMQYIQSEVDRIKRLKSLTDDQALIVYDQCLAREAVAMSRTSAADDAVFGLAHARCLPLRLDLLNGSPSERFLKFNALDNEKRVSFPELTKKIREQRQAFESQAGKNPSASH